MDTSRQRRRRTTRGRLGDELTSRVDLAAWPAGTRLICRRERPHPGAQLSFSDLDGHRFQCFLTDQTGDDLAALEARHRAHAVVEDRVRALKSMGLANLPFATFAANAAWLEVALLAHDITVWTQQLCLDGAHAICEPKRCSYVKQGAGMGALTLIRAGSRVAVGGGR